MVTIREVAKIAGVSTTTVSHVINNTRFVSDDVKLRVKTAMQELGYTPNALARSLRKGSTKTIGLVIPDNSNPFFAEIARTIEDIGYEKGYSVILCNSDNDAKKENSYVNVLIAKQVDGVVFITTAGLLQSLDLFISSRTPFVIVDREVSQVPTAVVLINNLKGGYLAAEHLIGLGHRRIACVTGPATISGSIERVNGYRQALTQAGLPIDEQLIVPGNFQFGGGVAAMRSLLNLSDPPTAVFFCNDLMAVGGMRTLHYAGIKVPDQVSVVGFDNIQIASLISPELTTIAQPFNELGRVAANKLIETINSHESLPAQSYTVLDPYLIVRDSTAAPAM